MFRSTKKIELGSCAFRQPNAKSHCRFLHGYRLTAKFWFEAKHLDGNNWVVDFGGLKNLKQILRDQFDHTTCISRTDPKIDMFRKLRDAGVCDLRQMEGVGIEKFAEWCFKAADSFVKDYTSGRCKCVKVEVFEHEDNSAIYELDVQDTDQSEPTNKKSFEELVDDEPSEEEKSVNQMKRSKEVIKDNITRPPFAAKSDLWPAKQKNTWLDNTGKSTWGF